MTIKTFNSEAFCGYTQISTFYEDFSIADNFGLSAIKDTLNRAYKGWKDDYKMFTELVMVLNWKSWEHSNTNPKYSEFYADAYYEYKYKFYDLYENNDVASEYFFRTTD